METEDSFAAGRVIIENLLSVFEEIIYDLRI
jgi:hypothetical protein